MRGFAPALMDPPFLAAFAIGALSQLPQPTHSGNRLRAAAADSMRIKQLLLDALYSERLHRAPIRCTAELARVQCVH